MNGTPKNWNLVLDWVISDGSSTKSFFLEIESYQMFQRQNYLKGYEWYTYEIELELSIGLGHIR